MLQKIVLQQLWVLFSYLYAENIKKEFQANPGDDDSDDEDSDVDKILNLNKIIKSTKSNPSQAGPSEVSKGKRRALVCFWHTDGYKRNVKIKCIIGL
jgi:hypothetical protein